jgi:uncharacterized protein DUF3365
MIRGLLWGTILGALLAVSIAWAVSAVTHSSNEPVSIEPDRVADYVHSVIQANRTIYATHVVEKMQEKGVVVAAEHWRQENALLLPAQFLIETGRLVTQQGGGIKYRLASLWPIYVWNAPTTDFERKGLEAVAKNPEKPYTGFTKIGRERFFQAVYADVAVANNCVECHNAHPNSPRRDFKLNDVMGGIAITIPLNK